MLCKLQYANCLWGGIQNAPIHRHDYERHNYNIWPVDDRGSRVRFPAGAGNFFLHHRLQNGSGAHPASYPMGTRGSFPGGEVDHSSPSNAEIKQCVPLWRGAQLKHRELIIVKVHSMLTSRDSSVGITTGYGQDDRVSIPGGGWESYSSTPCPDRLWLPPSLLSNGYQGLFPWG
jgi:hypothetical protein